MNHFLIWNSCSISNTHILVKWACSFDLLRFQGHFLYPIVLSALHGCLLPSWIIFRQSLIFNLLWWPRKWEQSAYLAVWFQPQNYRWKHGLWLFRCQQGACKYWCTYYIFDWLGFPFASHFVQYIHKMPFWSQYGLDSFRHLYCSTGRLPIFPDHICLWGCCHFWFEVFPNVCFRWFMSSEYMPSFYWKINEKTGF